MRSDQHVDISKLGPGVASVPNLLGNLMLTAGVCPSRYKWMGHFGPFDSPAYIADRVIFNLFFSKNSVLWSTLPKAQSERVPRARL